MIEVRAGIKIDVQPGVLLAQFGQPRKQPLAAEQRQHPKVESQHTAVLNLAFDRCRQFVEFRSDGVVKGVAIVSQLHRLMLAGEQPFADELLQRGKPAGKCAGRQAEFVSRSPGTAQPDDPHKGFNRAQRGKAADGQSAQSSASAIVGGCNRSRVTRFSSPAITSTCQPLS